MKKIAMPHQPSVSEADIRTLDAIAEKLTYVGKNHKKLLFISANPEPSTHFLPLELAGGLARSQKTAVVIDADLTADPAARPYEADAVGLTQYLSGACKIEDILWETPEAGIHLVPLGATAPNPSLLLEAAETKELLQYCAERYDWVLVNGMALTEQNQGVLKLAALCDGIVLVVKDKKTRKKDLQWARRTLEQQACPVVGCIVVDAQKPESYRA